MTRRRQTPLHALGALALLTAAAPAPPANAQQAGYGQTLGTTSSPERQVLDQGPGGSNRGGSLFDAANPLDLMNRLRRGTALDDATSPGDAVERALRDFEAQSTGPASTPGAGPSGLMQGP